MSAIIWVLLTPLVTALASLLCIRHSPAQRFFAVSGMVVLLVASLALMQEVSGGAVSVVRFGNWPAPFSIVMVADLLAAIMVLVSAIIGLAVVALGCAFLMPAAPGDRSIVLDWNVPRQTMKLASSRPLAEQ